MLSLSLDLAILEQHLPNTYLNKNPIISIRHFVVFGGGTESNTKTAES